MKLLIKNELQGVTGGVSCTCKAGSSGAYVSASTRTDCQKGCCETSGYVTYRWGYAQYSCGGTLATSLETEEAVEVERAD